MKTTIFSKAPLHGEKPLEGHLNEYYMNIINVLWDIEVIDMCRIDKSTIRIE